MGIYDSIIKNAPNSALDEIDFKKFKSQSQQQKSNRELSAGGGQNAMTTNTAAKSNITTRITFSMYDSTSL